VSKQVGALSGAPPLADDLEEEDRGRGGHVERSDLAGQGDGEDLVAGLADKRPEALGLRAEDDADGAGEVEGIPGLFPGTLGPDEPEALLLELLHGPDEVRDPGDRKVLQGPGRNGVDGFRQAGGAALGQDQAVGSGPFGAADDGSEVLGVFDLVEDDDEGLGRAGQDVLEGGVLLGRDLGHDALVAGRDQVQPLGRHENHGDVMRLGFVDDLADPGVAALLLDEDLVDPLGRGSQGFEEGIDADDLVHEELLRALYDKMTP